MFSLLGVVSVGAITALEENSTEYLEATGDDIGEARPTALQFAASVTEEDPSGSTSTTSTTAPASSSTTAPSGPPPSPADDTKTAADATNLTGAFAGGTITSADGTGNSFAGPGTSLGSAAFSFVITEPGFYSLTGSVWATNGNDNSFWVTVDGSGSNSGYSNENYAWGFPASAGFQSDVVNGTNDEAGTGTGDVLFFFEPGVIDVTISVREDGASLDSLSMVYAGPPVN